MEPYYDTEKLIKLSKKYFPITESYYGKGKPVKLTQKERLPVFIESMFQEAEETVVIYKTNYSSGCVRFKRSPDGRKALQRFLKITNGKQKKSSN